MVMVAKHSQQLRRQETSVVALYYDTPYIQLGEQSQTPLTQTQSYLVVLSP